MRWWNLSPCPWALSPHFFVLKYRLLVTSVAYIQVHLGVEFIKEGNAMNPGQTALFYIKNSPRSDSS